MADNQGPPEPPSAPESEATGNPAEESSRFPELEELQRDIERRLRDNRRFLERFMDEDFSAELDAEEGEAEGEESDDFEEL